MTTAIKNLRDTFKKGDGAKSELFDLASGFARDLVSSDVKHHQLRNMLDYVIWAKQSHGVGSSGNLKNGGTKDGEEANGGALSDETRGRVATLRPRLAYMAARMNKLFSLQKQMDDLLKDPTAITNGKDLSRLYDFAAALVAYHKYYGEEQKLNQQAARGGVRR